MTAKLARYSLVKFNTTPFTLFSVVRLISLACTASG